jgi:tRNA pseudouridine55 synthase
MPDSELSGILVMDKAKGMTSHDVVACLRRISGQRKVGHAGTLDPTATGVLLLCLGQATRVAEYLIDHDKTYVASIHLGISTETYDTEGQITSQSASDHITRAQVEQELGKLVGTIEQVAPMYSAVKHRGQPLYRLARRGERVARKSRRVTIRRLELLEWASPFVEVEIECSKGTYVRSLAHDLGQRLGCGAHLAGLVRTASGRFHIKQSSTLGQVERAFAQGQGDQLLLPLDAAIDEFPAVIVDPKTEGSISFGQRVQLSQNPGSHMCRAYAADGRLVALLRDRGDGLWQPHKVFVRPANDESHPRSQPGGD